MLKESRQEKDSYSTVKEHWFVLSWYFSPISTDPAVVGPIVLPLTDKVYCL